MTLALTDAIATSHGKNYNPEAHKLGEIKKNDHLDKWDNKVSLIYLNREPGDEGPTDFELVHFTPKKRHYARRGHRIWIGKGVFLPVETFFSDNDCAANWVSIAGFDVSWGDGDNLGAYYNEANMDTIRANAALPDSTKTIILDVLAKLNKIVEDDDDAVILTVLHAVRSNPEFWSRKEAV